jgi:hypothetical protein
MSLPLRSRVARSAAALTAAAIAVGAAAPAALAAPSPSPSAPLPAALYGQGDPTFDGVWRQSLALLALDTVEVRPASGAVRWLVGQQCADGGFPAYRADTGAPCDPKTEDTNATALAVQALAALGGHDAEVRKATDWLRKAQHDDGGWSFNPEGTTDANSTSLVVGAFAAAKQDPAKVAKGGKSPYDALASLRLGCDAPENDRGTFAYQPDKKGELHRNDSATAAAALAMAGKGLPVLMAEAVQHEGGHRTMKCSGGKTPELSPEESAHLALWSLVPRLHDNEWHVDAPQKAMGPDLGTTADIGLALAANSFTGEADNVLAWLQRNSAEWSKGQPAALAKLILLSKATAADPRDFRGADLVTQLVNLGPEPAGGSGAEEKDKQREAKKDDKDDEDGLSLWLTVGVGLLIGVGIGYLIVIRKKQD